MIVVNDQLNHHLENWDTNSDDLASEKDEKKEPDCKEVLLLNSKITSGSTSWETLGCGVLIGLSFNNAFAHSIEYLVAPLIVAVVLMKLQEWRRKGRLRKLQAQGEELAGLLARIGAPPMSSRGVKHVTTAIPLVTALEEFLVSIDYALERLQCATSLSLGLGLWSPSVHRVEHRRQSLESAKRKLGYALQDCFRLLNYEPEVVPTVVTLAWLKSSRQELVAKALIEDLSGDENDVTTCQERINELTCYVRTAFLEETKPVACPVTQQLARHLHSAEIALWAHSQNDEDKKEWLVRVMELLDIVSVLKKSLNPLSEDDRIGEDDGSRVPPLQPSGDSDISSFEHNANDSADLKTKQHISAETNKTLVFAGKGSVKKRLQNNPPPPSAPSISSMTQAMLFQELQTRLSTLDPVDEVNANVEEEHDDDEQEIPQEENLTAGDSSVAGDFGLSGSLFSELQNALALQNGAVESFCDDQG